MGWRSRCGAISAVDTGSASGPGVFRPGPGVFLIVNANDLEDAQRHMGRLPFVTQGLLTFDYTPMYEI
jgi:hypothetical protein